MGLVFEATRMSNLEVLRLVQGYAHNDVRKSESLPIWAYSCMPSWIASTLSLVSLKLRTVSRLPTAFGGRSSKMLSATDLNFRYFSALRLP